MAWFWRKRDTELRDLKEVMKALMEKEALLVAKRYDAELRRIEYDEKTVDARLRHEAEMAKWREEVKEKRRAAQILRNQTLPRVRGKMVSAKQLESGCRVCDDPSDISLTGPEILNHNRGHVGAVNNLPTGTYSTSGRTVRSRQESDSSILANNGSSSDAPLPPPHSK